MISKVIIDILDFVRISRVFNIHPNSSTYPFLMHSLNLPVPFPHPNKLVLPKKKKSTKLKEFLLKALQVGTTMSLLLSSPGFAIHPPVLPVSVWVCVSLDSKHLIFARVCVRLCVWVGGGGFPQLTWNPGAVTRRQLRAFGFDVCCLIFSCSF